jgi:DNA polymerase epsilon subunit 1
VLKLYLQEEVQEWLQYHKRKWKMLAQERREMKARAKLTANRSNTTTTKKPVNSLVPSNTMGGFLRRAQHALLTSNWQVIQVAQTSDPGIFKLWALVGTELHQVRKCHNYVNSTCFSFPTLQIRLVVPRIFYVNQRSPMPEERAHEEGTMWRAVNRNLPRGQPVTNLYRYTVPEEQFQQYSE